jgi:hypothetical protein
VVKWNTSLSMELVLISWESCSDYLGLVISMLYIASWFLNTHHGFN